MKNYKFSLEVLLEHRKRLENEARRLFAEAQANVDEATAKLNSFYDQVDRTRLENGQIAKTGGKTAPSLVANDQFIEGQKYRIETQRKKIRELKSIAEELQDAMVEAAKETKMLEKLKERQTLEHKKVQSRRELKATDELVTMRHKREGGFS